MTEKQRKALVMARDLIKDLCFGRTILNEESRMATAAITEVLQEDASGAQGSSQIAADQPKPEPAPEKSKKPLLEQTLETQRFLEEKGFSKRGVAYLLYCSTEFPALIPEKLV